MKNPISCLKSVNVFVISYFLLHCSPFKIADFRISYRCTKNHQNGAAFSQREQSKQTHTSSRISLSNNSKEKMDGISNELYVRETRRNKRELHAMTVNRGVEKDDVLRRPQIRWDRAGR